MGTILSKKQKKACCCCCISIKRQLNRDREVEIIYKEITQRNHDPIFTDISFIDEVSI